MKSFSSTEYINLWLLGVNLKSCYVVCLWLYSIGCYNVILSHWNGLCYCTFLPILPLKLVMLEHRWILFYFLICLKWKLGYVYTLHTDYHCSIITWEVLLFDISWTQPPCSFVPHTSHRCIILDIKIFGCLYPLFIKIFPPSFYVISPYTLD